MRRFPGRPRANASATGALLAAALLLGGCSLLGGEPEPEGPSADPPAAEPTGVDGPSDPEADEAFGDACTGQGAHAASSSAPQPVADVTTDDGDQVLVALGFASSDGPNGRLLVSTAGAEEAPAQFDGAVGDELEHDGVTVTITSICAAEVRFDAS